MNRTREPEARRHDDTSASSAAGCGDGRCKRIRIFVSAARMRSEIRDKNVPLRKLRALNRLDDPRGVPPGVKRTQRPSGLQRTNEWNANRTTEKIAPMDSYHCRADPVTKSPFHA